MEKKLNKRTISVIGLGYVGLPVAVAFGKVGRAIGFDVNAGRVKELKDGFDRTAEVESEELESAEVLFTDRIEELKLADFHIVAVPNNKCLISISRRACN